MLLLRGLQDGGGRQTAEAPKAQGANHIEHPPEGFRELGARRGELRIRPESSLG